MHEVAVAQRIVETLLETAGKNGGGRIRVARLVLGELTCIDPETLAFAFGAACRETCAEGCRLEVERLPLVVRCRGCGKEAVRSSAVDPCPGCGTAVGDVLQGREIRLTSLDLDEAPGVEGLAEEMSWQR